MTPTQKEILLSTLTILLGIGALLAGVETGISWLTGLLLFLYIGFFALSSIFISASIPASFIVVIPTALTVFFLPPSPWLWIGVFTALILNAWGRWQIRKEAISSPEFSARKFIRSGLPIASTGIALLISLFYNVTYRETAQTALIPKHSFDILLPHFISNIRLILPDAPEVDSDATVDEFLAAYVEKALEKSVLKSQMPKSQLDRLIEEERQLLSKELGVALQGDEQMGAVLYEVANKRASDFLGTYVIYIPLALTLGVFFALRALFVPLQWLATLFAFVLFQLSRRAGIIKTEEATVTINRYSL